jgi:hypothetical protein
MSTQHTSNLRKLNSQKQDNTNITTKENTLKTNNTTNYAFLNDRINDLTMQMEKLEEVIRVQSA